MAAFSRRYYRHPGQLLADLQSIWRSRSMMRPLMRGNLISPQFRERLMLAVTAVNACRYCTYAHSGMALMEGLGADEIQALNDGLISTSPPDQQAALLYAQHWAEHDGRPEPVVRAHTAGVYGEDKLIVMELAMQIMRTANLMGNTLDYALWRASLGLWDYQRPIGRRRRL